MYYSDQRRQAVARGIRLLWTVWAVSVGAIELLIILAPLLKPWVVPYIALALGGGLLALDRRNSHSAMPVCFRIGFIAQAVLLFTAIALFLFLPMIEMEGARELTGQPINPESPFIPVLIASPSAMIVTLYYLIRRKRANYCAACRRRNGESIDLGILGSVYARESSFQTQLLFVLSLLMVIVSWSYYFTSYINVNLNPSDRYFFIGIPTAIYLLSLIYLGGRYYGMWVHYCRNSRMDRVFSRYGTSVRFLFISGDEILIRRPQQPADPLTADDLLLDTPLAIRLPYRHRMPLHEAASFLSDALPGIGSPDLRFLYKSSFPGLHNNVFHFAVYGSDPRALRARFDGRWVSIGELVRSIRRHQVSSQLAAEIHRIYTVAMAWKTYDRTGRRLYPIRNYRPTFRLADMPKWDVDYGDKRWIAVAGLNQDRPFFRLRRLWRRLIHGEEHNPSNPSPDER